MMRHFFGSVSVNEAGSQWVTTTVALSINYHLPTILPKRGRRANFLPAG
jgi:hypothetical protein